jgi:hypothetical protein
VISFVIPAHNVEPYIEQCLNSILSGAGDEIEVIVVDDGSTDGTRTVIQTLARGDARVRLLPHDRPAGAAESRNDGLAAATGEYVWFVDADDWLFDGALEHVLPRLGGNLDLLFVNHVRVWDDGAVVGGHSTSILARAPSTSFTMREWPTIAKVSCNPWNKIISRSLLVEHSIAFPLNANPYEEYSVTFEVLVAAKAIEIEQFVCYAWRTGRPGQLTRVGGEQHLAWADQWRAALKACANEPTEVRAAVFKSMIRHGWGVLADPVRLRGPLRREFFRLFSSLYNDQRGPGLPRNLFLASRSWTLARLRLLPRQTRARLPPGLVRLRDRVRAVTIAIRRIGSTRRE